MNWKANNAAGTKGEEPASHWQVTAPSRREAETSPHTPHGPKSPRPGKLGLGLSSPAAGAQDRETASRSQVTMPPPPLQGTKNSPALYI